MRSQCAATLASLTQLHRELMDLNPSAARSLAEGLEETLTVHRLRVPPQLRKTLACTNIIESAFSIVERVCRNVKAIGAETSDLEWLLRDLLRQGERKLIFDLAGVDQIDADAALFLVRCFFVVRGSGGELRFAGASAHVARPFRATTLDTLLPFDPVVTAACEYFRGGSQPG